MDRVLKILVTISIHAPRVGSDAGSNSDFTKSFTISIHAPRVGSDGKNAVKIALILDFNPRSPCGERRPSSCSCNPDVLYFNPRSPCGERHKITSKCWKSSGFQSTLPVWGATMSKILLAITNCHFNPRSPCGERQQTQRKNRRAADFNPRSPCGERRSRLPLSSEIQPISIHAPRVGSDNGSQHRLQPDKNFNPRSPCGERRVQMFVIVSQS